MPLFLGVDIGTTTVTSLALDASSGLIAAASTRAHSITSRADKPGRVECDVEDLIRTTWASIQATAQQLGERTRELAGIGITGQQHGILLIDANGTPRSPFINWQDQRGEETFHGTRQSYVQRANELVGVDLRRRTGCRLATGYAGITVFWLKCQGMLPAGATACFLPDYVAVRLTALSAVTDPTLAASSGIFDIDRNEWDTAALAALDLSRTLLPEVRPSGELLGKLADSAASLTGLPAALPVYSAIGDNQASFLGSVASPGDSVLVNVGTGGQVAMRVERRIDDPILETRPFPRGGFLSVCAGLCGGRSYALLENLFRQVAALMPGAKPPTSLFALMNAAAAQVPRGADGLRCEPFFSGTRHDPALRGCWTGISMDNLTPGHLARALLEGMARAFRTGYDAIASAVGPARNLVGSGNGIRENPLLAQLVADAFALPLHVPCHREEAAFGAALLASVAAGCFPDLVTAARVIRYEPPAV